MCTELILALVYFITIVFVNYFLFSILKKNLKNIYFLFKIFFIFSNFKKEEKKSIFYSLIKLRNNEKNNKLINYLNQDLNISDLLIIGYTYKFLNNNFNFNSFPFFSLFESFKEKRKLILSNKLYLNLLINHYLFELI